MASGGHEKSRDVEKIVIESTTKRLHHLSSTQPGYFGNSSPGRCKRPTDPTPPVDQLPLQLPQCTTLVHGVFYYLLLTGQEHVEAGPRLSHQPPTHMVTNAHAALRPCSVLVSFGAGAQARALARRHSKQSEPFSPHARVDNTDGGIMSQKTSHTSKNPNENKRAPRK